MIEKDQQQLRLLEFKQQIGVEVKYDLDGQKAQEDLCVGKPVSIHETYDHKKNELDGRCNKHKPVLNPLNQM